jgi:hypothetical protein
MTMIQFLNNNVHRKVIQNIPQCKNNGETYARTFDHFLYVILSKVIISLFMTFSPSPRPSISTK